MSERNAQTGRTEASDISGERGLDRQYRKIGISAVAAAAPYCGKAKSAAYGSVRPEDALRPKRSVLAV
jgi:hypothetical protein